ncbi:DUF5324 family protein [Streptomyces sp. 549]|uniref:DUF5324 family protein n=1 Tax=Streptomyces sp. 549 TaxID=3049076 RepID=UPI0024C36482|nr:DUF5324 family protein [Streptomyces sp. 549]MDK1473256.1 DUF5324 family protein [Streptomyces sp. 549]
MTRKDSLRAATGTAKDNVRHAAGAVSPKVGLAAKQAQHAALEQYENRLAPRLAQARDTLPPVVDQAAARAAKRSRKAAQHAAEFAAPKVVAAKAAAGPARDEAVARSAAALAALRGEVTAKDVRKLSRRKVRRARTGRAFKRLAVIGVVAGVAVAAWRWWDKQANPDWLVEPPEPTEVDDRAPLSSVDGSLDSRSPLDPEVQAKQADADAGDGDSRP